MSQMKKSDAVLGQGLLAMVLIVMVVIIPTCNLYSWMKGKRV